MRIRKKIKHTDKYPLKLTMSNGMVIFIPQQKKFGEFCQAHGCSMAACNIGLQLSGIMKDPDKIYKFAKANISGVTGSKLTIFGCESTIKEMGGSAKWYPITGTAKNKKAAITRIRKALKEDAIVLIEQKKPIHTNVIIATRKGGVFIATNGKVKRTTIPTLYRQALRGRSKRSGQIHWYKGGQSDRAAGYVVVRRK